MTLDADPSLAPKETSGSLGDFLSPFQRDLWLTLAAEAADIGLWEWDLSDNSFCYSERAKLICGFRLDREPTYEDVVRVTHPEDFPRTSEMARRALDPTLRERQRYEYRILRPDGTLRWVVAHGQAIFAGEGDQSKAVRYVGALQDVTEEKNLRDAERASARRLALAVDSARMAVWEVDLVTGEVAGSPELNTMFGFPVEANPTLEEFGARYLSEDEQAARLEWSAAASRGDRFFSTQRRLRLPDGARRWIQIRAELHYNADGAAERAIGVAMDITRGKEKEQRLDAIFSSDIIGLAVFDFATGETLEINDALLKMTGYSRADFQAGKWDWRAITPPEYLPLDEAAIAQAREQGAWQAYEKEYERPNGERFWVRIQSTPLKGETGRVVVSVEDVTQRKGAEAALRASEARLSRILNSTPVGILETDGAGMMVFANPAAETMLGLSASAIAGRAYDAREWEIAAPDGSAIASLDLPAARALRGEFVRDFAHSVRNPLTGKIVQLSVSSVPIRRPDGVIAGSSSTMVDVTERHSAEQAVRQNEERLRRLADLAPAFVWFAAPNGDLQFLNKRWYEYTGQTASEALPAGWAQALHPADAARTQAAWAGARERGDNYEIECRFRRTDGAYRWYVARAEPLRGEDGQITGWFGTSSDIHDLRVAQERLARGLDAGRMVVWELDVASGLITRSENAESIFGAGVMIEDFYRRMPTEDAQANAHKLRDAIEGRSETYDSEFRYRHPDGRWLWLHNQAHFVRDTLGRAIRGHGVAIDVTQRKTAELALKELNARLEGEIESRTRERARLYELSDELFATASFDGYLKDINAAWTKVLGYSEEELLARPFIELVHPDDLSAAAEAVALLRSGGSVRHFDNRLIGADGRSVWLSWAAVPMGDRFYAVGRDVTNEKVREEALRQAQKMEAIGQLTGGIAHDFNNLLGAVSGAFDLIRRKPDQSERVLRYAEQGLVAVERGARLTSQLLAFSRSQRLDRRPISLKNLLGGVRELLAKSLGPMIELEVYLSDDDLAVVAEPTQLEMALLNLAINARDAMPAGGALVIAAGPVRLLQDAELADGEYIELSIRDTGVGMNPETASRAFEPFFTTKSPGKGTGLGLAQVYAMMRQIGGAARLTSEPGKGTTVRLYLQRARHAPDAAFEVGDELKQTIHAGRALVVDDDDDMRLAIVEALEAIGYDVTAASSGFAGLDLLAQSPVDVLVLDFAMPGMNGAEAAAAARRLRPGVPIVFVTGYADTAAIQSVVGGSTRVLRKPFRIYELQAVLNEVLSADAPRA